MTRTSVIVDTNIVVAGLITANDDSPVAHIFNGMIDAKFSFVLSESLLAEYRTVLLRPHLIKLHKLKVAEIEAILTEIALHAIVLSPKSAVSAPDPGDQMLWDLLCLRDDLVLITGDKLLLSNIPMHGRVITALAFVTELRLTES